MCVAAHSLVQRQHLHAEAQAGLARSAMRHTARRASRAAPHSNFGRMLQGLPHAAGNCAGSVGGNNSSGASPVIAVAAFGADPTGVADSSDAFDAALAAAIAQTAPRLMASRIRDLGGVRIDLQGGDYALSRPFRVPRWLGNFKIGGGSVRALPSFPRDRYLIEIGGDGAACAAADPGQKSCNANVGIEDLLVDGGNGTALPAEPNNGRQRGSGSVRRRLQPQRHHRARRPRGDAARGVVRHHGLRPQGQGGPRLRRHRGGALWQRPRGVRHRGS
jgi:hypothetical protein